MTFHKRILMQYGVLGILVFIVDRYSKLMALTHCSVLDEMFSFVSCYVTINRGISWGMINSENEVIFLAVSLMITLITVFFAYYAYRRLYAGYVIVGEICIIAGSCSNIVDRFIYAGVIDFILLSYKNMTFPVFNFADVAIVFGVTIMMLQSYWEQ